MRNKKGFTLIEMLVVIAVIAVLISIVIPVVGAATTKAEAAVDAANLRNALGYLNTVLITQGEAIDDAVANYDATECKLYPDAELHVLFSHAGFIDVYYVDGSSYYGLKYFSDMAENGSSSLSTEPPTVVAGDVWYTVD